MSKIAVIGAGAWGTTISLLLAQNNHQVTLWVFEKELVKEMQTSRENEKFLPGFQLPENIEVASEPEQLESAQIFFFVVPTQFLRSTAKQFKQIIPPEAIVVCASKGIENKTSRLPLDILAEELGNTNLVILSGPNLSAEIAKGLPAAAVAASVDEKNAKTVQETLMLERFRVYTNTDPLGVQIAASLKNIMAIAAGIIDELDLGNNAKAGLLIRGMAEITRLGLAMGAKAETFAGLSGMGDLITTCSSKLSRNHYVGEQIALGKKLTEIVQSTNHIAEGVTTTKAALELAKKYKVTLPITEKVYQVLYEDKDPFQAINELMTRTAKSE
ncbi:glycerol-3-phosphate dehydrogenase [candidate division WOR-1 bacterium RIFOXYB2_FULL_42_35]|uniref:Glycerol-3-phosphate dehydrogenase [NAD(P)+] n=1 Tax=candidate division WOR-1 bacterium RIFOXYC2_FULL_41_25 TaxID=1802586 RepID=A0A1F4TPW7_UNCSA|nr:MAG: glycerol-3-phosphate dehydrogenase [candidate division WOR-1 bacterium RIFOXYA2_FULL_41_14]OGC25205.1 MAG: glycerol-3-phosphate dehydrogenase [candidate division WOR-1 bacterium RIFOXYB2_FULL_42_35]OGC34761.1 MAG: glycerol-3-phosphate dehydrogenase [candidate division WOR-1 bacterium RIFOXYC2_FULL_41_25]OGC43748.1 MAG: glycerol-3-phosphate dehydrogenase [candidate division WOR-1 bacterium RIFOXYD2_FULL_41_8]